MSLYARAGIQDVAAFYRDKFAIPRAHDFLAEDPLLRFDIGAQKVMWILERVRPGARVLDFGCGSGTLAALRHRGCSLFGVELSASAAALAKGNGYQDVFVGDLAACPYPEHSFDHVVSLDVLGHVEAEHKNALLSRLKRWLKDDGSMLHGIECGAIDYARMTDAELRAFVQVDGHVGMESREAILARFRSLFAQVEGDVQFVHCMSKDDLLHLHEQYGRPVPRDLVECLRTWSPSQSRAFDLAMGLVFQSLVSSHTPAPATAGGFLMLQASDRALSAPVPFEPVLRDPTPPGQVAMQHPGFGDGWHEVEDPGSGPFRWAAADAQLCIALAPGVRSIEFELRKAEALGEVTVAAQVRGRTRAQVHLRRNRFTALTVPLAGESLLRLRLLSTDAYVPREVGRGPDGRSLSILVRKVWLR